MIFKNITLIDENFNVRRNMNVCVRNDRIVRITEIEPEEDFGEVYDGSGKLLLPSFCNTHSHLPMSLLRGYAENLSLMEWLNNRIFPFEAKLTREDIYRGTLLGIAEMLRYGIGSTTEMYLDDFALADAFAESGVKANFCSSVTCFDGSSYGDHRLFASALEVFRKYNGFDNGRLVPELSVHAEYTNTEKMIRGLAEAAAERGQGIQVHVSESQSEVAQCMERHEGRSPVKFLSDCGLFDVPATAAHCVHLSDEDISILKDHSVTVSTCPKSNLKLASGICPVSKLLNAGVNVGIGTDSVASNNNLNIIEEMRFFALLQKGINLDPVLVTPAQALYAATRAGAISQRRPDCGLIKEGYRADITVMNIDTPYMKPEYSALNNLVYSSSGSDVVLTMVDGRILYKDGEYTTLDIEKILYECDRSIDRITSSLS